MQPRLSPCESSLRPLRARWQVDLHPRRYASSCQGDALVTKGGRSGQEGQGMGHLEQDRSVVQLGVPMEEIKVTHRGR